MTMQHGSLKGAAIAGALTALFASGLAHAEGKTEKAGSHAVKCSGANDCKGKGACKSAKNDCKGKNACKGHGFTEEAGAKECAAKGGQAAAKP
jgi:hypothetical protein